MIIGELYLLVRCLQHTNILCLLLFRVNNNNNQSKWCATYSENESFVSNNNSNPQKTKESKTFSLRIFFDMYFIFHLVAVVVLVNWIHFQSYLKRSMLINCCLNGLLWNQNKFVNSKIACHPFSECFGFYWLDSVSVYTYRLKYSIICIKSFNW